MVTLAPSATPLIPVLERSSGTQKPPAPEALAKSRANCCPPDELVKLLNDVGSCTVESKMPTKIIKKANQWNGLRTSVFDVRFQLTCSEFSVTKPPLRGNSLLLVTAFT